MTTNLGGIHDARSGTGEGSAGRLQGWQYEDGALVRGVPVTDDSRDALIEAAANASADTQSAPEVHVQPDLVVLRVGEPSAGGVTPDDVELAARIDQVLVGSASDQG